MQSSKVLMPTAANADDDPQAAQVSPVSTDFWAAHGRMYQRGRTWPGMAQLTTTRTLAEAVSAGDCAPPPATARPPAPPPPPPRAPHPPHATPPAPGPQPP